MCVYTYIYNPHNRKRRIGGGKEDKPVGFHASTARTLADSAEPQHATG